MKRLAYLREPQRLPVLLSADEAVRFLEAIDCAGQTRREVAQRAQEAIRAVVRAP